MNRLEFYNLVLKEKKENNYKKFDRFMSEVGFIIFKNYYVCCNLEKSCIEIICPNDSYDTWNTAWDLVEECLDYIELERVKVSNSQEQQEFSKSLLLKVRKVK